MTQPDERLVFDLIARDKASREFDRVGDAAVRAGRDFDRASDGASHLQLQIDETTIRLRELGREFDRTGDRSLLKDISRERRTLAGLQRLRRELFEVADAAEDVGRFSFKAIQDSLGTLPSELRGAVYVGLIGGVAAAAPVIAAGLAGAVTAGVSGGAIAAGIASAARDQRVRDAWEGLAAEASRIWDDIGAPFVQPTIDAIGILRGSLNEIDDDLAAIARDAARFVRPLAEGVGGFVEQITPGLRELMRNAEPVIDMLAAELPRVGATASKFFEIIGEGSEGGADGLRVLLRTAEVVVIGTAVAIKTLADHFHLLATMAREAGPAAGLVAEWLTRVDDAAQRAGANVPPGIDGIRRATEEAGEAAQDAATRFERLFGLWMDLDETADRVEQAFIDLTKSLRENGAVLSGNSQKAIDNRDALRDVIRAAAEHRQAMIDNGASVAAANEVYLKTIERLYAQATAAGVSRTELDKLLAKYRELAKVPNITKSVTVRFVTKGSPPPGAPPGMVMAFQHGGLVEGPGPKGVDSVPAMLAPGEFVLSADAVDRIGLRTLEALNRNAGLASAAASTAPSAATAGSGGVVLDFSGLSSGDELLAQWFHRSVRTGRIQLRVRDQRVVVG